MKKEKKFGPYNMYLGNLFTVKDGIGEASKLKYVVVKTKEHPLAKAKYICYPGNREVLVGQYEIDSKDPGYEYLINAKRVYEIRGWDKLSKADIVSLLMDNNDHEELEKVLKHV